LAKTTDRACGVVGGRIIAMNDNELTIEQRIKMLEAAAQKARLEAIDVAGRLLARRYPIQIMRMTLEKRYATLTKIANEAQTVIDRLLAEALNMKRGKSRSATRASLKVVPAPHD
jgi:hypothetical protein